MSHRDLRNLNQTKITNWVGNPEFLLLGSLGVPNFETDPYDGHQLLKFSWKTPRLHHLAPSRRQRGDLTLQYTIIIGTSDHSHHWFPHFFWPKVLLKERWFCRVCEPCRFVRWPTGEKSRRTTELVGGEEKWWGWNFCEKNITYHLFREPETAIDFFSKLLDVFRILQTRGDGAAVSYYVIFAWNP